MSETLESVGSFLTIKPGVLVAHNNRLNKIVRVLTADKVLIEDVKNVTFDQVYVHQLKPASTINQDEDVSDGLPHNEFSDSEIAEAKATLDVIKPLLDLTYRTRAAVAEVAEKAKVNISTIYKWIKLYEEAGTVEALVPRKRGPKAGNLKLSKIVEAVVTSIISEKYLASQQLNAVAIMDIVERRCAAEGLQLPHINTIRNRINAIAPGRRLRARGQKDQAKAISRPHRDIYDSAQYPLHIVQMDHTRSDIVVVYEDTRKPWGRPWITLAIDCRTRMIVGFYIRMAAPSGLAANMCLAMGMLPKAEYLEKLGVKGHWPVYGGLTKVHCDNAKEFKGETMKKALDQYEIDLVLRPVKQPEYGGHIERMIGNINAELHKKPGTTFSNPTQRGDYNSKDRSAMTLRELEADIVDWIVNQYHLRLHSFLKMPPIKRWELDILGDGKTIGIGLPKPPANPEQFKLDFMPHEMRSVQNYGIAFGKKKYYHEVLNRWINAVDKKDPKRKRKFIVRYNPGESKRVWFWDPDGKRYYEIPTRNLEFDVTQEESLAAENRKSAEGKAMEDKEAISASKARSEKREEDAVAKTKAARRGLKGKDKKGGTSSSSTIEALQQPVTSKLVEGNPFAKFHDLPVKPFSSRLREE